MNQALKIAMPIGRVLITLMFLISGTHKIETYEATQQFMVSMGVPGFLVPVILLETIGALMIMLGIQVRLVAAVFCLFCLSTAGIFHTNFDDTMQFILFLKNISITGGFILLIAYGSGSYSIDNYLLKKKANNPSE